MVKKWIIMIIIVLIVAGGCVFESLYINNSFINLKSVLVEQKAKIEAVPEEELFESGLDKEIKQLHDSWHTKVPVLKCLIWHSGVKDVEVGMSRIQTYIKENEKTEALAEINSLIDYLRHYSEDFTITIENIL